MFAQRAAIGSVVLGTVLMLGAGPVSAQPKSLVEPPALPQAQTAPQSAGSANAPPATKPTIVAPTSPPEGLPALVPLGPPPGNVSSELPMDIENPVHDNPQAIASGRQLFKAMNCADCHGYNAEGGTMAPSLTNGDWKFGGTPVQIFKSIYEGRPTGMPAWGKTLPPQTIWDIVAYIQSLGGTVPPDKFYQAMAGDKPGELTAPQEEPKPSAAPQQQGKPANAPAQDPKS